MIKIITAVELGDRAVTLKQHSGQQTQKTVERLKLRPGQIQRFETTIRTRQCFDQNCGVGGMEPRYMEERQRNERGLPTTTVATLNGGKEREQLQPFVVAQSAGKEYISCGRVWATDPQLMFNVVKELPSAKFKPSSFSS